MHPQGEEKKPPKEKLTNTKMAEEDAHTLASDTPHYNTLASDTPLYNTLASDAPLYDTLTSDNLDLIVRPYMALHVLTSRPVHLCRPWCLLPMASTQ